MRGILLSLIFLFLSACQQTASTPAISDSNFSSLPTSGQTGFTPSSMTNTAGTPSLTNGGVGSAVNGTSTNSAYTGTGIGTYGTNPYTTNYTSGQNFSYNPSTAYGTSGYSSSQQLVLTPLYDLQSPTTGAFATVATQTALTELMQAGYLFRGVIGCVLTAPYNWGYISTVGLPLFYSQTRGSFMEVATNSGITAAQSGGFSFVEVEGYGMPTQLNGYLLQLDIYYSATLQSYRLAASGQPSGIQAQQQGFQDLGPQLWAWPPSACVPAGYNYPQY